MKLGTYLAVLEQGVDDDADFPRPADLIISFCPDWFAVQSKADVEII